MVDISYFLHSSVLPEVASHNHSSLLQYYHRAHTEAIKSFGMHGYEMEMEDLLTEYHAVQVNHRDLIANSLLFTATGFTDNIISSIS